MGLDMKREMKKDINGDKNIFSNSEKNSYELGSQPRKSGLRAHKSAHAVENYVDEYDKKPHQKYRDEPNKKAVRVQLRRIERLF